MWGKVIGGVTGFALGGPIGAVVGAAFGHAADSGGFSGLGASLGQQARSAKDWASGRPRFASRRDQVFAVGVVLIAAKLSRADGPIVRAEIDAFKRCFRIPQEAVRDIGRLYDHARDSDDDPTIAAAELGRAFADNRGMLEDVLAALFAIARADRPLNRAEERFLRETWLGFALDEAAWMRARDGRHRTAMTEQDAEDPYAVLGVTRETPDEAIRAAWRQLMRDNHPDALASKGVPASFIAQAGERVARFNAAWDRVKRERGL